MRNWLGTGEVQAEAGVSHDLLVLLVVGIEARENIASVGVEASAIVVVVGAQLLKLEVILDQAPLEAIPETWMEIIVMCLEVKEVLVVLIQDLHQNQFLEAYHLLKEEFLKLNLIYL